MPKTTPRKPAGCCTSFPLFTIRDHTQRYYRIDSWRQQNCALRIVALMSRKSSTTLSPRVPALLPAAVRRTLGTSAHTLTKVPPYLHSSFPSTKQNRPISVVVAYYLSIYSEHRVEPLYYIVPGTYYHLLCEYALVRHIRRPRATARRVCKKTLQLGVHT